MLSEFVRDHREEIIARCRARVAGRIVPRPTPRELEQGIPLFLGELEHTLACKLLQPAGAVTAAVQHGENLLRSGFTIAQVVHNYGGSWSAATRSPRAGSALRSRPCCRWRSA